MFKFYGMPFDFDVLSFFTYQLFNCRIFFRRYRPKYLPLIPLFFYLTGFNY